MSVFTFVKLMMTLVNLLIFLSGITIMALGLWVSLDKNTFLRFLGLFPDKALKFFNIGYYCIATGGWMVLLGILGFSGAKKESKCLLLGFFSIILIIFITQVASAAVVLYYSSVVSSHLAAPPLYFFWSNELFCIFKAMEILVEWQIPALKNIYGTDVMTTNIWDTAMTTMSCCGFFNYTDFVGSKFEAQNQGNLPPSCCGAGIDLCSCDEAERRLVKANSALQGCYEQILTVLKHNGNIVGAIVASTGGLEIAAMVVSSYLYCYLDN
ncbi:tetraspanin-1 [Oryzias latipes]|uniref:tetraspanin-1 n=1 Tax=Oryzias latipes TaxID=8090 RepID=UPI000CE287A6|nr:tetraspanin-1 [Oryzias latipes]